jgi:hypothetical protein
MLALVEYALGMIIFPLNKTRMGILAVMGGNFSFFSS